MKHLFVTYEIAKKLKELGFNEMCLATFQIAQDGRIGGLSDLYMVESNNRNNKSHTAISAPLWQQAIDWINSHPKLPLFKDHVPYYSDKELLGTRILSAIEKIQSVN